MVPAKRIIDNGYNMTLSGLGLIEAETVEHPEPEDIPLIPPLSGGGKDALFSGNVDDAERDVGSFPDKGRLGGVVSSSNGKGGAGKGEKVAFLPYNNNLTAIARENRKSPTKAESKIWNEVLRRHKFSEYKFLRQKPLAGYIVDFYCSELRLVIEIDGDTHAESVEYDKERTSVLNTLGLSVVRYTNDEVLKNIEGVADDLMNLISTWVEQQ